MLSEYQQSVIDTILKNEVSLIKVNSVAGSKKFHTEIAVSKALGSGKQLYIAHNRAMAIEAKQKFLSNVECKTAHNLAYHPVVTEGISMPFVISGPRKVDLFSTYDIKTKMSYDDKLLTIQIMNNFFLSAHTSLSAFLSTQHVEKHVKKAVTIAVKSMIHKLIPCTHAFYLKYYHILLAEGVITPPQYDLIILDEAGDVNAVTLEIFKLLPSKKKLLIGDMQQNIYTLNGTINSFEAMKNEGILKHLPVSYRVSTPIAKDIQTFCRKHLDNSMQFIGVDHEDTTISTKMFISRTNSSLVAKMIELNSNNIRYNITRKVSELFSLLFTLMYLKSDAKILNPQYRFLLDDLKDYSESSDLQQKHKDVIDYIAAVHNQDIEIKSACATLSKYGEHAIYNAYNLAKKHEKLGSNYQVTLSTVHASKGFTADEVILDDDMYPTFLVEPNPKLSKDDILLELRLIYVAVTCCRLKLTNASWLTTV